jgi:hypothetical protein
MEKYKIFKEEEHFVLPKINNHRNNNELWKYNGYEDILINNFKKEKKKNVSSKNDHIKITKTYCNDKNEDNELFKVVSKYVNKKIEKLNI